MTNDNYGDEDAIYPTPFQKRKMLVYLEISHNIFVISRERKRKTAEICDTFLYFHNF